MIDNVPLPFEPQWLERLPIGGFLADNGVQIYCIGDEGETIICFQNVSTEEFMEACKQYEIVVEDSYDEDMLYHPKVVEITYDSKPGREYDWVVYWGGEKNKAPLHLALVAHRW